MLDWKYIGIATGTMILIHHGASILKFIIHSHWDWDSHNEWVWWIETAVATTVLYTFIINDVFLAAYQYFQ